MDYLERRCRKFDERGLIIVLIKYSSLREKDLDYMRFILRNGVVTAKQIYLNFEEKNMDAVYRRLRKLKDGGYVKHQEIAHKVGFYFGTKEARNVTEVNVTLPEGPSVYTIRHTLLMTDLVLYYQLMAKKQVRKFSYKTEREIRFEALKDTKPGVPMVKKINKIKERVPDIIFNIEAKEGKSLKIWIEMELHQKDNNRYKEKFKERFEPALRSGEYDQIWYFSDAGRIRNAVNKAKFSLSLPDKLKVYDIPAVIKNETWEEVLTIERTNEQSGKGED